VKINPEKYIREKSRNLPIYKCWINGDWEIARQANIIIAREHANGNLTVCFYVIDLGCLGIIASFLDFNCPAAEIIQKVKDNDIANNIIDVPYVLVHNIIFSSVEYAEDLGFKPAESFTKTMSFFLEEDNDDIPLISIECGGNDGKPLYIASEEDSEKKRKQIMAQLEKAVGKGNFNYFLDDDNYYDAEYEEIRHFIDKIDNSSKDEQIEIFLDLEKKQHEDNFEFEEFKKLKYLTEKLSYDFITEEDVKDEIQSLHDDLDYSVVEIDECPDTLFSGIEIDEDKLVVDLFNETFQTITGIDENGGEEDYEKRRKKGKKALMKFKKAVNPDAPLVHNLELLYLERTDKEKYKEKLEKYYTQHPDCFLTQLLWHKNLWINDNTLKERISMFEKHRHLLSQRHEEHVSDIEYNIFIHDYMLNCLTVAVDKKQVLVKINAVNEYLLNSEDIFDLVFEKLAIFLSKIQTAIVLIFFEEEVEEEKF
jgi:hypothetical protein